MTIGYSDKTEKVAQVENIRTIETVLQNTFTDPDDELIEILNDMEAEEKLQALTQYEENLYKDYFADDTSYLEFVSSYGSTLMLTPMTNDYKFKVKNIEYEKTDSKEIIYNFSVELQSQKEGSELSEVAIVDGQANLNEAHKIERMIIRVGDFLSGFDK